MSSAVRVTLVRSVEELANHVEAWDALAKNAVEPNLFYESWMVLPGARAFIEGSERFEALLVHHGDVLAGFFPLLRRRVHRLLPIERVRLFDHLFSCLCIPLVHQAHGEAVVDAFLDWLASTDGAQLAELSRIGGDGPFYALLVDAFNRRGTFVQPIGQYTRALIRRTDDVEEYLRVVLSSKTRGKLRRYEKQLADEGPLEITALAADGDVEAAIEEFLALEASGWKGQEKSAMNASADQRGFFVATMREAHRRGRLELLACRVGGRAVAMKCNLWDTPGSYTYKTAFDERYAKQSPGLLLEIDSVRRLHGRRAIAYMDSAGSPKNPMYDRLWTSRRSMLSVLVGSGAPSGLAVSLLPLARWVKRSLRDLRTSAPHGGEREPGPAAHDDQN
jgi:CelD/BcsL family acetyltransferase involved in cellulose biosynthesis